VSVLVIEYGPFDKQEPSVLVPGLLDLATSPYMSFNLTSTPQQGLGNRTVELPAGAAVGGGTVVNGIFFDRGGAADYDAWSELGATGWDWAGLLPYFKKVSLFTKTVTNAAQLTKSRARTLLRHRKNMQKSFHYHGMNPFTEKADQLSPVIPTFNSHLSVNRACSSQKISVWPNCHTENFFEAWHSMNITTPQDPGSGQKEGVFWAPSSLQHSDQTRSYARKSHYDRVKTRSNYHILPETAVSSIVFENKSAVRVEYISTKSKSHGLVTAHKEVILAAGSMHTPQILQLSGVGPRKLLEDLGVDVVMDSPGVGQNFQDHPTIYANFTCKYS
jgi:choline dehydrogenase